MGYCVGSDRDRMHGWQRSLKNKSPDLHSQKAYTALLLPEVILPFVRVGSLHKRT